MICNKCGRHRNPLEWACPCTLPRSRGIKNDYHQGDEKVMTDVMEALGCVKDDTPKDLSESGAQRNAITSIRYDLLDWNFIDQMATVMAEGAEAHGENNWKGGFDDDGRDIDNHAIRHYREYEKGDRSELHLAKVAIGMMFKNFHENNERGPA